MRLRTYLVCLIAVVMMLGVTSREVKAAESADMTIALEERTTEEKEEISQDDEDKKQNVVRLASVAEPKAKYNSADLRLLSSLIYCEAGNESYAGKLAVGIVVMNRKSSSQFPGSLKGVVYQKYQFGPVTNGALKKALSQYDSKKFTSSGKKASVKAAKEALSGTKKVSHKGKTINMSNYLYFSGRVKQAKVTIGGHQFR